MQNLVPKFSPSGPLGFPHHRSGWEYAMNSLRPLLTTDGVLLDTFIEDTFCWNLERCQDSGVLPYCRPWVGFVHNPPGIPEWHEYLSAPQHILNLPAWRESLPQCRGLFTFSAAMREWLAARLQTPVAALIHPTESTPRAISSRPIPLFRSAQNRPNRRVAPTHQLHRAPERRTTAEDVLDPQTRRSRVPRVSRAHGTNTRSSVP